MIADRGNVVKPSRLRDGPQLITGFVAWQPLLRFR